MQQRKLTKVIGISVLVTFLIVALAVGASAKSSSDKVFHWKYFAMINLKVYAYGPAFYEMCEEIKEKTNGRLQIDVYLPGEVPYSPKDYLRAIKEGATQMAGCYPGYFSATQPVLVVTNLPMLMPPDAALVEKVYDDIKEELFQPIFAKWDGVSVAEWWFPFHAIGANVPITSWDSLKGTKVRVTGKEPADFIKMLGGVPVTVSWSEVPTAVMTGVIDAVQTSGDGFWSAKLWEYDKIKYINLLEIASMPCSLIVSKTALAELPDDVREIFLETTKKYQAVMRDKQWMFDSYCYRVGIVDYGVNVVAPSKKFRAEMVEKAKKEVWEPWAKRAGADGQKALDLVLSKIEEYSK
jgi:TRAP-type C4-dicarboxylate transport system substrate-binding protein